MRPGPSVASPEESTAGCRRKKDLLTQSHCKPKELVKRHLSSRARATSALRSASPAESTAGCLRKKDLLTQSHCKPKEVAKRHLSSGGRGGEA